MELKLKNLKMEDVTLDMAWYWDSEPNSPDLLSGPTEPVSDWSILHDQNDVDFDLSSTSSSSSFDEKHVDENEKQQEPTSARALLAQQLLEDIDNIVKKETFSEWFDSSRDALPLFDEIPQMVPLLPTFTNTDPITSETIVKPQPTTVEWPLLNHGQLTPPQTPPPEFAPLISQPIVELDLATELAVVDEVVRNTAQKLDVFLSSCDSSSRCSSSSSSSSSGSGSSSEIDESDDPEWMPQIDELHEAKVVRSGRARSSGNHRVKPYNVEDKKLRKKEQNKNAATRYRMKKKAEVNVILEEEKALEERNIELDTKAQDVQREISYLKGLMREMFRAKGLIK